MRELNYIDETIEKNENPALRIGSVGRSALSTVYLMDCIEGMKQFPDKIFDLAVVDPPYGIGWDNMTNKGYYDGRKVRGWTAKSPDYNRVKVDWDIKPQKEYFDELFRVSKKQIIWGGNHFELPTSKGWIFWDKLTAEKWSFGDGELAWTSFLGSLKKFTFRYAGMLKGANGNYREKRFHPTQKPIPLYDWIFKEFASEGNLILDTHLGSQSSRIAANKAGLDFVGFEIDREYYDNGNKRLKNFVSQGVLF
jgi:site-specific DNA-methyltransferase (adenine-specific)